MNYAYLSFIVVLIVCVFFYTIRKILLNYSLKRLTRYRTFTVSLHHPLDQKQTMELISINADGSATIKTLYSSETLTAKPSEYFIGKDFGSFGLRLLAVSHDKQEIILKHTVPEDFG